MGRKITIEPVTRVEGHGKVTIRLDDAGKVTQSRFHIVEFRGFERFVQGRPYWEAPVLVQRLCGICPVSHHLAAAKAMDVVVGAGPGKLTATAEKMRRLMHYGQMLQSHALHFFHLASPDFLLGMDADPAIRNVIGIIALDKDLATRAVLLRKFGQEIILATAGKKIHGTGAVPGGVNKNLSPEERDRVPQGPRPAHDRPDDRMVPGGHRPLQGLSAEEQGPRRRLRRLPLEPPQPRPQGRGPRLLSRRACGPSTPTAARSSTTSITRTTSSTSARRRGPGAT